MGKKSLLGCQYLWEVAENFSLAELVELARKKNLHEWLDFNFYNAAAEKILNAIENNLSDAELKLLICEIFNISLENLSADDTAEISALVAKKQRDAIFADKISDPDKKVAFVESQAELVKNLHEGANFIYLYGSEFHIPYNVENVTYIGRGNAIIDFDCPDDIDLDARNIILEDLQVYVSHPITIKADNSTNIKILNGARKTVAGYLTLKEIFDVMRGRGAFETHEKFAIRAENIQGVAVGSALLDDADYEIDPLTFKINPNWNLEYIAVLRNFAKDKDFSVKLEPENAERLYTSERKLQIFADFAYVDGALTILNLYFDTKILGRIDILSVLREKPAETVGSGSGFCGLGYGLELITDFGLEG